MPKSDRRNPLSVDPITLAVLMSRCMRFPAADIQPRYSCPLRVSSAKGMEPWFSLPLITSHFREPRESS